MTFIHILHETIWVVVGEIGCSTEVSWRARTNSLHCVSDVAQNYGCAVILLISLFTSRFNRIVPVITFANVLP